MSKLKTAQAVHKSLAVGGHILKWAGIAFLVGALGVGLAAWANAHFLSFVVIVGVVLAFLALSGALSAWDWSQKVIKEAKEEERRAMERNRLDKEREENAGRYSDPFEGYDDPIDPMSAYR